jgi:hypothetical protein
MNESGGAIRKAYFTALNNQVNHPEGGPVTIPVVDEKLDLLITEHDLYILISGQSGTPKENKSMWVKEEDINITVVNRRKATNSKVLIENIAGQVLTIILPTRTTNGLNIESPFKLTYARLVNDQTNFEKMQDGWRVSKSLIFRNHITQS